MGSVNGRTVVSIDDLVNETIINGTINLSGHLILETRGGASIDAGLVTRPFGSRWLQSATYVVGDVVGYAGIIWKALQASTGKVPALFETYWTPLHGMSDGAWSEKDSNFVSDSLTESWEFFWKTGTSTPALTSVSGEFETGKQALKITMAASSSQRFYLKEENIVRGGEVIQVTVRAKLQSAVAGCKLEASILQNDDVAVPEPFASGLSQVAATEGQVGLTTSWANYRFTMTAANAKPRGIVNLIASCTSGGGAVMMIDSVTIRRYPSILLVDTDWIDMVLINSWVNFDSTRTAQYCRLSGLVLCRGYIKNGTVGTKFWVPPATFRPEFRGAVELALPVVSNNAFGSVGGGYSSSDYSFSVDVGNTAWVNLDGVKYRAAV